MTLVLLIPSTTKSEGCLVLFTILNPLNKTKSTSKPEPRLELLKEKKKQKTTKQLKEQWKEKQTFIKRTLLGLSRRRNYSQEIQEKEVSKKEGHQSDDCTTKRKKSLL